jgi:hypothetical protein
VENLEQMAKLEKSDLKVFKAFQVQSDPPETRVWLDLLDKMELLALPVHAQNY